MATKIPSKVSTHTRDEMVCPDCFHEGLEPHPGYIDDYTGDAAILRATRCPDETCQYHFGEGVPRDLVDQQYVRSTFVSRLTTSLSPTTVLMGVLVLAGMLFLASAFLGISLPGLSGGVDVTVSGTVTTATGSPVANATVEVLNGSASATTGPNGQYRLENLTAGTHVVSINPQDDSLAASSVVLKIKNDGSINASASHSATLNGTSLTVNVKEAVRTSVNGSLTNGTVLLNYSNPKNAEKGGGVSVVLAPPPGKTVADQTTIHTGTPKHISIPGGLTSQAVVVKTGIVEADVVESYTWNGAKSSMLIKGNLPTTALRVDVSPDSNQIQRQFERKVRDGDSFERTIRGEANNKMKVTFWGGSATAPYTERGTYSGHNPTINISDESAPAQVSVVITGSQRSESKTSSGTITNGDADVSVEGTLPAKNAVIQFTGGTPENSQVGDVTVSADGSDGTQTRQSELFTAESTGSYRVEYDFTEERNGHLVEAGYKVNGDLTKVATGSDQTTLNLTSGDAVSLWVRAEQESHTQAKDYQRGDHEVYVTDTRVSATQVEPGEAVTVTAVMDNQGDAYGLDVYLFTDGTKSESENEYFSGGEKKEVTFTVRFSEEGAHTVSVNEGDQISIQVGDDAPPSGAGSLSGTATRLGDGGTVKVDTNGDGTPDCTTEANGGSCDLGSLPTGSSSIDISQQGVTNTGFEMTYDARFGAKGVSVDIDADGVPEITESGELSDGETLTGDASVGSGLNPVLFKVKNGGTVEYEIQYTEAGQVTKPRLYVDGELVIDETENFKGSRTYNVSGITAGSHTFTVGSENKSNTFNVRLQWTESGDALYPALNLNGRTVCHSVEFVGDNSCTVPNAGDAGSRISLSFNGGASSFNYTASYTARATPESVAVSVNGQTNRFYRDSSTPIAEDGSWTTESSVSLLEPGLNRVTVNAPDVDGLSVPASATLTYTYQAKKPSNPTVVVVNSNGKSYEKEILAKSLDSEGFLNAKTQFTLPSDWFTRGENKIRIVSSNGGVILANVTATVEHGNDVRQAPTTSRER